MKRNRYKLIESVWHRWEGTKENGQRVLYTTEEGHNLIENVTPMELRALGEKIKLVGGVAPLATLNDDEIVPLEGEFEDITAKPVKTPKPASVAMPNKPKVDLVPDTPTPDGDSGDKEITIEELLDQAIGDVLALIKNISDADQLKAIRSAEKKGKDRKGVITALDNKLDAAKG